MKTLTTTLDDAPVGAKLWHEKQDVFAVKCSDHSWYAYKKQIAESKCLWGDPGWQILTPQLALGEPVENTIPGKPYLAVDGQGEWSVGHSVRSSVPSGWKYYEIADVIDSLFEQDKPKRDELWQRVRKAVHGAVGPPSEINHDELADKIRQIIREHQESENE